MPRRPEPDPAGGPGELGALRLVREVGVPLSRDPPAGRFQCRAPADVSNFMRPYAGREEGETLWILALDTQHRVIFNEPIVISRGLLDGSLVHPREVFRAAVVAGAAGIVLIHNHPSGNPAPSADDRAVTRQLVEAGRLLDVPVFDHVIIGEDRYASFAELGLL